MPDICHTCGAPAPYSVWNGRNTLGACAEHYNSDETIWLMAVMEFANEVREAGLSGMRFADLHDRMDPNQLMDDFLRGELECRDLPARDGDAWLALVNGAAERYDEWYTVTP